MESREHAVVGAVVSTVGAALLQQFSLPVRSALWTYGLLLSVFVDLDHFLVARLKVGDWSHLRRAVENPVWAFTEQEAIFEGLTLDFERLLSHTLLGGVLTVAWYVLAPAVAAYTAAVLYFHILADVVRETGLA
jgi:hypothetical protein